MLSTVYTASKRRDHDGIYGLNNWHTSNSTRELLNCISDTATARGNVSIYAVPAACDMIRGILHLCSPNDVEPSLAVEAVSEWYAGNASANDVARRMIALSEQLQRYYENRKETPKGVCTRDRQ